MKEKVKKIEEESEGRKKIEEEEGEFIRQNQQYGSSYQQQQGNNFPFQLRNSGLSNRIPLPFQQDNYEQSSMPFHSLK